MSLTKPENIFPGGEGIDPRDQDHPMFPKEMPIKIFLKPLVQRIIEKNLWVELLTIIIAIAIGLGELFGRQLSSGIYFSFGCLVTVLLWRFINIENETHNKTKPIEDTQSIEEDKK